MNLFTLVTFSLFSEFFLQTEARIIDTWQGDVDEGYVNFPDVKEFPLVKNVTWQLASSNPRYPTKDLQNLIQHTFDQWSEVTGIRFHMRSDDLEPVLTGPGGADFRIEAPAEAFSPENTPAYIFLYRPGIANMKFFDSCQSTALDDDVAKLENFACFQRILLHTFGHAVGLVHSNDTQSIMYNYFNRDVVTISNLSTADLESVEKIYGAKLEQDNSTSFLPGFDCSLLLDKLVETFTSLLKYFKQFRSKVV